KAPKIPVPIIIEAVISVAVLRPSVRARDVLDSGFPDCCPASTCGGVGSLFIFDLKSRAPSHKKSYRALEPSDTTYLSIDSYTTDTVPKTFVNFPSSKSTRHALVIFT